MAERTRYLNLNRLLKKQYPYRQDIAHRLGIKDKGLKALVGIIVSALADPSALKYVPYYIYTIA